jgi:hypothetical protein
MLSILSWDITGCDAVRGLVSCSISTNARVIVGSTEQSNITASTTAGEFIAPTEMQFPDAGGLSYGTSRIPIAISLPLGGHLNAFTLPEYFHLLPLFASLPPS